MMKAPLPIATLSRLNRRQMSSQYPRARIASTSPSAPPVSAATAAPSPPAPVETTISCSRRAMRAGFADYRRAETAEVCRDLLSEGVRAGHDLEDLLGDLGLAGAVQVERQAVDQLDRVLGGIPHRGHAGAVLGRGRLEQRAVDLGLEIDGQEPLEDLLRLGLVDEVSHQRSLMLLLILFAAEHLLRDRQHLLFRDALDERRDVVVVDEHGAVDLVFAVELGKPVGDRLGVAVAGPVGEAGPGLLDLVAAEPQGRAALPPDDEPAHLPALRPQRALEREGAPEDLPVECAGKAAVAGERDDRDPARLALLEQRQAAQRRGRPRGAGRQLLHPVGVVAKLDDPLLGPPQPRRSDELHRLGDLARVPDGADPPLDVLQRRHYATSGSSSLTAKVPLNFSICWFRRSASSSGRSPVSRISLEIDSSARMSSDRKSTRLNSSH